MNVEISKTQLDYPYLAVWTGRDNILPQNIEPDKILILSVKLNPAKNMTMVHIHSLTGSIQDYFTTEEGGEYTPLPNGYKITLTQQFTSH